MASQSTEVLSKSLPVNLPIANAMMLTLAVAIACLVMPTPIHFLVVFAILLLAIFATRNDALYGAACVAAFLSIVLNWVLASAGIVVFKWDNVYIPAYAKVIAFFCFCLVIYKKANRAVLLQNAFRRDIIAFSIIIAIACLQSLGNFGTAASYVGNVFLPLTVTIIFCKYILNNDLQGMRAEKKCVDASVSIVMFVNFFFCVLFYANIYDIHEFVSISGAILRSPGSETLDFKTVLMGMRMDRFSGLFPDPIIAGYFLAAWVIYSFICFRFYIACFISIVAVIFIALTLSKGSALVLVLGISFIVLNNLPKLNRGVRFGFIIGQSVFVTAFMIWWGLREGTTDSSAVHVLGLILPFMKAFDLYYIIGNGLGTAGNLGGWVEEGAESFFGLVQYSMGIVGTALIIFWWCSITWRCTKTKGIRSSAILGLIVPLFVTGALQENVFNLPYIFPRLLFVAMLVGTDFVGRDTREIGSNLHLVSGK